MMLGVCSGKPLSIELERSALTTKIGGQPRFHVKPPKKCLEQQLICEICGLSNRIVLVAQVYTPLEFNRSLYIFCCNSRKCALTSKSWIVLRNQASELPVALKSSTKETIPVSTQTQQSTIWSGLSHGIATDITFDDLESLLDARDGPSQSQQTQNHNTITMYNNATCIHTQMTPVIDSSDSFSLTEIHWPAWSVSEEEEQVTTEDMEEEGEGVDTGDEHTNEAYRRYLEEEEDRELVAMLDRAVAGGGHQDTQGANLQFEDDESEEVSSVLAGHSAAETIELEFQRRCALQPRQVFLLYVYICFLFLFLIQKDMYTCMYLGFTICLWRYASLVHLACACGSCVVAQM